MSGRGLSLAMALWTSLDRQERKWVSTSVRILRVSAFGLLGSMTPGQILLPKHDLVHLLQSLQTHSTWSALPCHPVGHLGFPSLACLELGGLASLPVADIRGGGATRTWGISMKLSGRGRFLALQWALRQRLWLGPRNRCASRQRIRWRLVNPVGYGQIWVE